MAVFPNSEIGFFLSSAVLKIRKSARLSFGFSNLWLFLLIYHVKNTDNIILEAMEYSLNWFVYNTE